MHIIKPLTNKVSEKVKSWSQIKKEALELKEFMDAKKFEGQWKDAWAISHCQVSNEPKSFFVVNKKVEQKFGHWCIINLKIVKQTDPCLYPEACMSFMFRQPKKVKRFVKVTVTYSTPFLNLFLVPRRRKFNGDKDIEAFIVQHESDHSHGQNIYNL
jgi:peptide deformylase